MSGSRSGTARWLAGPAAIALGLSLAAATTPAAATPVAATPAAATPAAAAARIPSPRHDGRLRITGELRDGSKVRATGLSWHPGILPHGDTLLSFAVAYAWRACPASGKCVTAADSTATPFAARSYIVGHADTGRRLEVTETAAEVVETSPATFAFTVIRTSVSYTTPVSAGAYPAGREPSTEFVNGTPERRTSSAEEYFQVDPPHYSATAGAPAQQFRVDGGRWRALPASRVFYTGKLRVGRHEVQVRTADASGTSTVGFRWRVVPMPAPVACRPRPGQACWYPPHLNSRGKPMRWDWQIGRVTPLQRTGARAVDIYDVDGFLTTAAEVHAIHASWQAATLPHPKLICYLDLAWEDYRPDGSPGGVFPAATLGAVYYGYPEERWVDFRQLDALKPMLDERIEMCARKGFDAVELDDIDSFDPPSTTGFHLTPGDAQNYLAYAFNEIHRLGMTALWKNSPYLSWWGRRYADGAIVEECYVYKQCLSAQLRGSKQYGITCTALHGATPCGWDDFTTDRTSRQPTGKWVGEAEYSDDDYVCNPGQHCTYRRLFATFCRTVYAPSYGFAAVKFDVNLDGKLFYPCPAGT
jgi:Glycoside-hydrolase family GH114